MWWKNPFFFPPSNLKDTPWHGAHVTRGLSRCLHPVNCKMRMWSLLQQLKGGLDSRNSINVFRIDLTSIIRKESCRSDPWRMERKLTMEKVNWNHGKQLIRNAPTCPCPSPKVVCFGGLVVPNLVPCMGDQFLVWNRESDQKDWFPICEIGN